MCKVLKNPQDALQKAISYEDGIKRQESMGVGVAKSSKVAIKREPVYAVDRIIKIESFRCGAGNFTEHVKRCPATNHNCEYCDIMGQMEKYCNQKYPETKTQMNQRMHNRQRGKPRINYVSENSEELADVEIVLQVEGTGVKPFMVEGLMCGNEFKANVDTGSPVAIFAVDELKKCSGLQSEQ